MKKEIILKLEKTEPALNRTVEGVYIDDRKVCELITKTRQNEPDNVMIWFPGRCGGSYCDKAGALECLQKLQSEGKLG